MKLRSPVAVGFGYARTRRSGSLAGSSYAWTRLAVHAPRTVTSFSRFVLGAFSTLLWSVAIAGPPDTSTAIEAVKKKVADCKECVFFALPAKNRLIGSHSLFFVSTVDRLPPPYWTVGISKTGEAYFLDAKNIADWNRMISSEKVSLSTDAQLIEFAKTFLDLAVARAIYIQELHPGEKSRIKQKTGKEPMAVTKIVKEKGKARVQFYAKDVAGALQQWDLIVLKNGRIEKADVREF